jgi:hypothetical protein
MPSKEKVTEGDDLRVYQISDVSSLNNKTKRQNFLPHNHLRYFNRFRKMEIILVKAVYLFIYKSCL